MCDWVCVREKVREREKKDREGRYSELDRGSDCVTEKERKKGESTRDQESRMREQNQSKRHRHRDREREKIRRREICCKSDS